MKAILVIDTTKCGGCPFCQKGAYYSWCDAPRKERSWEMPLTSKDIEEERTVECPLRPLPKRNEYRADTKYENMDKYSTGYADGYNACRSEVAGETE